VRERIAKLWARRQRNVEAGSIRQGVGRSGWRNSKIGR
jgi:hypothetical protein